MAKGPGKPKVNITQLRVMQTSLQNMADSKYRIQVGIFGDKNSRPQDKKAGPTNAEIGYVHEMGSVSRNIPQRSFLWATLKERADVLNGMLKERVETMFKDGQVQKFLKQAGTEAVKLVQMAFQTGGFGKWKPLQPETIARKGSAMILVDSSQLRRSITYRVVS